MISTQSPLEAGFGRPLPPETAGEAKRSGSKMAAEAPQSGSAAAVRDRLNVRILQSSLEVSIQAGEKSQALVFRSAIDRINELLAPEMGPDAIQGALGEDNSAEATAGRILSLSTGFFETYAAQRPGDDAQEVAKDFVALIRGGFEKGFNDAKDILKGLDVLGGDIESGIMKTFELVQQGLDDFLAGKLQAGKEGEKGDVAAPKGGGAVSA